MRLVRHPLVGRDVMGIFDHVLATTGGDAVGAERRLSEIDALLAAILANPLSGARLDGSLSGWLVRHGGRDHKLTVVFRPEFRAEPEADLLRIALIAFGGRDWLTAAAVRRG